MKRCIAFCLALGAALSLTACGGGDTEGGLLCEASGIRPDTVLLSVDGRDVSAQRYSSLFLGTFRNQRIVNCQVRSHFRSRHHRLVSDNDIAGTIVTDTNH